MLRLRRRFFGQVRRGVDAIVDRKCDAIAAAGADAVVGGDLGCLLNIEGRLRRRGDETTRCCIIAEVLAGEGES
jgi:L-lactate dehydrogenase complex protein LldE